MTPFRAAVVVLAFVLGAAFLSACSSTSSNGGGGSSSGNDGTPDSGGTIPPGSDAGVTCGAGTMTCGATCVAVTSDVNNCGGCGTVCGKGQSCVAGKCGSDTCNGSTTKCGSSCVSLKTDPANCGRCGNACTGSLLCSAGACAAACTGGATKCGNACIDTSADPSNCGACGNVCKTGTVCAAGACVGSCPGTEMQCGQACVDTTNDPANCSHCGFACNADQACVASQCVNRNIRHVVVIVEENHTFDSYFGMYCTAPTGSNPSCTSGPDCCERAPLTEPSGAEPTVLNDDSNVTNDRNHAQDCERTQIDNGRMDHYVTGGSGSDPLHPCSAAYNWALADDSAVGPYWDFATNGAIADRYFQPIVGSTSSNDMYFAVAQYQFVDNADLPDGVGAGCVVPGGNKVKWFGRTTIADLLLAHGNSFGVFADGYSEAKATWPSCPSAPPDCPNSVITGACKYDPSDIPFEYYGQLTDNPSYMHDSNDLPSYIANGLPDLTYVKARTFRNEHPGWSTISRGTSFVTNIVDMIEQSPRKDDTLILLTWDEGGGFFDHISPPPALPTQYDIDDNGFSIGYGTRVPMIAIGKFARVGAVSHVQMEHSSIVRFLEWNFLGNGAVGALGHRDAAVNNIGSMLDPAVTGVPVPTGL